MSNQKVKLQWEGDKVRQSVVVEDLKFTPKDMLDSLDDVRNRIVNMKEQENKMKEQLTLQANAINQARTFEHERATFEGKCLKLNIDTLKNIIKELTPELVEQAKVEASAIIDKDPSAYNEVQKENHKYVIFQRKLATHKKVAEKISKRLITNLIFDTPIFENPFK